MGSTAKALNDEGETSLQLTPARVAIIKIVAVTIFTILLGFAQGWSATRTYKTEQPVGFWMGLAHGMMMPAAFPGLVMGHDLPIYAGNNNGRHYNTGFILGINACGVIFFGISFWQPRRRQ